MERSGYLLTLEGPDGGGKTTQIGLLAPKLRARGLEVVVLREPGGTSLGETLRGILLDPERTICPAAEALLYAASRAQMVHERVLPSLRAGKVVVLERFLDSSLAYQAYGLGLPAQEVLAANRLATGGISPNLTILLDIDPAWARHHRLTGPLDRVERRDELYHRRVREGFLDLARAFPERIKLVDASLPVERVEEMVWGLVEEALRRDGYLSRG